MTSLDNKLPRYSNLQPGLLKWLSYYAVAGCATFAVSVSVADFVVPDHDWIADTISDLGAGRYEFIVDIGIYAFSASLLATALLSAHLHLGGPRWSLGVIGLGLLALIVFLIGARNEYGDKDNEGVVIHVYLVYVMGLLMAVVPWLMSGGAYRVSAIHGRILVAVSIVWAIAAPIFFYLPDTIDGAYERFLGMIAFAMVATFAHLFIRSARSLASKRRE